MTANDGNKADHPPEARVYFSAVLDPTAWGMSPSEAWLAGFVNDDAGMPALASYSEHPQPDGSIRIQALYKRKDGSFAEL
jgi:hypothetical protein